MLGNVPSDLCRTMAQYITALASLQAKKTIIITVLYNSVITGWHNAVDPVQAWVHRSQVTAGYKVVGKTNLGSGLSGGTESPASA